MGVNNNGGNAAIKQDGSRLFWKLVGHTLICSLIPRMLVGWGIQSID